MKIRRLALMVLTSFVLGSQGHAALINLPNASFESPDFVDGCVVLVASCFLRPRDVCPLKCPLLVFPIVGPDELVSLLSRNVRAARNLPG